jgi:transposase
MATASLNDEKIAYLYAVEGLDATDIKARFGCCLKTVYRALERKNILTKTKRGPRRKPVV